MRKLLIVIMAAVLTFSAAGCSRVQEPKMALIKGGCFEMGDVFGDGDADERPVHKVCLDDFYLGVYEVTQEQWQRVMGDNPATFKKGGSYPVETVSWDDVQDFIRQLNLDAGKSYRLPTEAEWEYAAREGGRHEQFDAEKEGGPAPKGPWLVNLESREGFRRIHADSGPRRDEPMPVGSFKPNRLGLYDMTGNVWEWIADGYDADYYRNSVTNNPKGPASSEYRVIRGGSWGALTRNLRVTNRNRLTPSTRVFNVGLRLALSAPKQR